VIVSGDKAPPCTRYSLRGSELTALEAVDCEWRYALLVVQTRNDDDDDDDDCIGSTLGKLSRVLSIFRDILHWTFE